MNLHNRKRIMMVLMSLMLSTTGCGNKDNYKTNGFDKVQEIMDNSDFYQTERFNKTYEEIYGPFYQNYLRLFAKYMTEDQYNSFLGVVTGMNFWESKNFVNTYSHLDDIFDITSTKEGRCFFKCFNSRIMIESNLSGIRKLSAITPHITTIRSIVNNDDAFFKSIYSGNIDKVIDCICQNTGFKNRELVEELIFKMDLYHDIAESEEYMDGKLRDAYETRVREIIGLIIEAKCANDEDFNNCLYARLLRGSSYFNQDNYAVIPSITVDEFFLGDYSVDENYCIYEIDRKYLYEDISLEEIRRVQANKIIDQAMHPSEDNMYAVEDPMKLLMSIIDVDILNTGKLSNGNAMRLAMYENLGDYFASVDEFNSFIIKLHDHRTPAFEKYFDILIKRIEEDGINYDDFIRYLCLVNYNKDRTYTSIQFLGTYEEMEANYVPDEVVRAMKESEWDPIAYSSQDNFLFWSFPYQEYFAKVESILGNNDLGYNLIFNPDCQYVWDNGEINVTDLENSSVLSSYINPKTMEYNGTNIIYYEIPKYYETATAVETFYNIANEFITRDVKGFKTTIEDPQTGEEKLVFVLGIEATLEDAEPIRFILDYNLFLEAKKDMSAKGLYLGGYYV